uniref:L-lactate dehydrogenase n=1 Tax=Romanomermis culicivorax TaxID=13658 RepID=A0A915JK26_ROMCU
MPHKIEGQETMELDDNSVLNFIKKSVIQDGGQSDSETQLHSKVTVIGVGQVGMACAFSMLVQHVARELVLIDVVEDKLKGECMDLQHGLPFIKNCTIKAGTDYALTANSDIVVITAGARQRDGESRLALVERNVEIFRGVVAKIVKYSPNCTILVVSNPVDVMTFVTWKLSGFPKERIIGSGTNLDSARFKFLLSERLNVAPISCHGWIIGEHGDSSVAVWSGANIAGVKLCSINPKIGTKDDPEDWASIHKQVGIHGVQQEVFLSLPAVIGRNGVTDIIRQTLTDEERQRLQKSAENIYQVQKQLKL